MTVLRELAATGYTTSTATTMLKGSMMRTLLSVGSATVLIAGLAVTAAPPAHAAPPSYTIEILGPTTSTNFAEARKLNDAGDVVGIDGNSHVLWRASDRAHPVTIAEGAVVGAPSLAGISGEGVVAGQRRTSGVVSEPYIWINGGLTAVPGPYIFTDVSESGTVLGSHAHLWTSATSKSQLPDRNANLSISDAYTPAISPNGKVVAGNAAIGSEPNAGVRWNNGELQRLKKPAGSSGSWPNGVNDRGVTVGYTTMVDQTNGTWRPAIWDSKGTPSWLPQITGFALQEPLAINNSGVAVGRGQVVDWLPNSYSAGLVWADGKVMNLDDVVARPSGSSILEANDINASGQIVGRILMGHRTTRAFIATPKAAADVDVYTTPGIHHVNGRDWKTTCEKYSQTTRCRTEIQATQVRIVNGRYVHVHGWAFNNLTYLPSARSLWKNNPLAIPGDHTVNGRKWRTECETPRTGRNGCRSYILGSVIKATPKGGGRYSYTVKDEWIFNNIVKFT